MPPIPTIAFVSTCFQKPGPCLGIPEKGLRRQRDAPQKV